MTESEWFECSDPGTLICSYVDFKEIDDRQARLLICGCFRLVWHRLTNDQYMRAVNVGERFAVGLGSEDEILAVFHPLAERPQLSDTEQALRNIAASTCSPIADLYLNLGCVWGDALRVARKGKNRETERRRLLHLIRDVLGNPFCPVSINSAWLNPTVSSLAQAAYDERIMPSGELELARLAVLSDALEEAGCDNDDIMNHLRGPGPHVRGCWAVDLLLGKE
jgi:hypothetical protein